MPRKRLDPVIVNLKIEDCGDCPCVEMDVDYTICMMKGGPKKLPVYRREGQVITPPKDCPLRKMDANEIDASQLVYG